MAEERNFYEETGFTMPEGVGAIPAEGGFDYYKHPSGTYRAIFGKMKALYKDPTGKSCEQTDIGASLYSFINYLWITQYLGTSTHPEKKDVLVVKGNEIIIPRVERTDELYFANFISYLPKDQWMVQKKFENFMIPGHEKLRIVHPDPSSPSRKMTNFNHFPHYYGFTVEFNLALSAKNNTYIDNIKLLTDKPKVTNEVVRELEINVDALIKNEIEARKAKKDEGYKPSAPPEVTDFSSFTTGSEAPSNDGLDEFLNG